MSKGKKIDQTGRSIGDGKHVQLYRWMTQSPAWRALPHTARSLYVELGMIYNGANNGSLFLSIADAAAKLDVSENTARNAFAELEQKGFIEAVQRGSFNLKSRHATSWRLTEYPVGTAPPSKEFMKWRPSGPAEKKKPVSKIASDGIKNCVREVATASNSDTDGIKNCPRESDNQDATVSKIDAHIVYQVDRGSEPDAPTGDKSTPEPNPSGFDILQTAFDLDQSKAWKLFCSLTANERAELNAPEITHEGRLEIFRGALARDAACKAYEREKTG